MRMFGVALQLFSARALTTAFHPIPYVTRASALNLGRHRLMALEHYGFQHHRFTTLLNKSPLGFQSVQSSSFLYTTNLSPKSRCVRYTSHISSTTSSTGEADRRDEKETPNISKTFILVLWSFQRSFMTFYRHRGAAQ